VQNSTLSGNSASDQGGGIYNYYGTLTVQNGTLTGNSATYGGGIYNYGMLNYANTIIANSTAGGDCCNNKSIGANTNNLVEDGSCFPALSGDPNLGPLADNGPSTGSGWTHALLSGSPAIDAVPIANCTLSTDQRGEERNDLRCDIGAYELRYADSPTVIRPVSSTVTTTFGSALVGIRRDPAATNPGVITVTKSLTWKTKPGNAIDAYWYITPSVTTTLNLTLTLCYTPTESNSLSPDTLRFWRFSDNQWQAVTGMPVTSTVGINQCATLGGITKLSAWTLGGASQPTAVVLRGFRAHTSEVWWPVALLALGAAALIPALSRRARKRR
jgi:hypothetical protein